MACSNCYNNCPEIVSDKCVRYTGIDVPVLGIQNGDSLSYVEQALIEFLTSTLDGTGIKIDIPQQILCDLIKKYLPTCGDLTVVDLFETLIKATCDLQVQVAENTTDIASINTQLAALEGPYNIGCLTGVTSTSGTHAILQAVITKLCQFILDVQTNYVQLADINNIISSYISSQAPTTQGAKMIPFTAVEYYGPLSYFDGTGAGLPGTEWEKIYLCNGQNGTPDKRGVVPVGINDGTMLGGPMSPKVDPAITGNPTYSLTGGINGSNTITLTVPQMPSHTHAASASTVLSPATHNHGWTGNAGNGWPDGAGDRTSPGSADSYVVATKVQDVTISASTTVTNDSQGSNEYHTNYQPGLGCYYIMYIP